MTLRIRENANSRVVATYQSLHDEDLSFEDLLRELEAPSARFLEAATLFLVEAARLGDVPHPPSKVGVDVLRRIGFIADRLGEHEELTGEVRTRLRNFALGIYEKVNTTPFDDLGFSHHASEGRIRRLQRKADAIDRRWRVWGEVELRHEFLR